MELLGHGPVVYVAGGQRGFLRWRKKSALKFCNWRCFEPKYAVLDETDSGLDIDALKTVAHGVTLCAAPIFGILLITHYQRLLNYIIPDHVHVMVAGRIVRSGRKELALELEERGYDWARDEAAEPAYR